MHEARVTVTVEHDSALQGEIRNVAVLKCHACFHCYDDNNTLYPLVIMQIGCIPDLKQIPSSINKS